MPAAHALALNFTSPTDENGTAIGRNWTTVNISVNTSNLDIFKFNWNGTNYSIYDGSLVLALSFNNNSAIGENSTRAVDVSGHGNNGSLVSSTWSTSGVFGGSVSVGNGGFVNVSDSASLRVSGGVSLSVWMNLSPNNGFSRIDSGYYHSCGVLTNGSVLCWGYGADDALGDSSSSNNPVPGPVSGNYNFSSISAGGYHTCGVLVNGNALCWGSGSYGMLGDSSTLNNPVPDPVSGSYNFSMVSAGEDHTCGVLVDGRALCWGYGGNGALGDGSGLDSSVPVYVSGSYNFSSVSAGAYDSCGVLVNGSALCWGSGDMYALGGGSTTQMNVPTPVSGNYNFSSVSAGYYRSCGVLVNGSVLCWGNGGDGALGDGSSSDNPTPGPVSGNYNFSSVSAGYYHSCGVLVNGSVLCWGYGGYGELGNGIWTSSSVPVPVNGGYNFSSASVGMKSSCTVSTDGSALCWGYSGNGELGDGSTSSNGVPGYVVSGVVVGKSHQSYALYSGYAGKIIGSVNNASVLSASNQGWHHFALTYDGAGTLKLFADGLRTANRSDLSGSVGPEYANAQIGVPGGMYDEARIYSRGLSEQEVRLQYQSEFQKYNSTTYRFYANLTNLSNGTYTYYGWANDTSGNSNYTKTYNASSPRYLTVSLSAGTTPLALNFSAPTEENGTTINRNWTEANISITAQDLDTFKFNWNGTNYSVYGSSLVLAYNYNDNPDIGESTTLVTDISPGSRNNATCSGNSCPSWDPAGRFGGAYRFDGVSDYLDAGSDPSLDLGGNFTVMGFFKPANNYSIQSDYYQGLLDKGSYQLYLDKSDGKLKFFLDGSSADSWRAAGSGFGASAVIYSLASYNGTLYAGGNFGIGQGAVADYIARWNGISWSSFGASGIGTPGPGTKVYAMTVYKGDLYAAGSFDSAGGISASNIARWNGSAWNSVGSGLNTEVHALAVYNGSLYAGGQFITAGGTSVSRIARWNGSSWNALGSGMNNDVDSLVVYNGSLYAGGKFTTAGGSLMNYTARWDGSSWSALGFGTNNSVYSLATYNGSLYAGGTFTSAGGAAANYTARWDGSSWNAVGSGMTAGFKYVYALAVYDGSLFAGGYFTAADGNSSAQYIARWNGSVWTGLNSGVDSYVYALTEYNGSLYAGGDFQLASGVSVDRVARWSGNETVLSSNTGNWGPVWNHFTITRNSSTLSLYINGSLENMVSIGNATVSQNTLSLLVGETYGSRSGGHASSGAEQFDGELDEFRIYNRSLSPAEINMLYKSEFEKKAPFEWHFYANLTNLTEGNYTYYGWANNTLGYSGSTEQRTLDVDLPPTIQFVAPTTGSGYAAQNYIKANVTATDDGGIDRIFVSLNNSAGYVNSSNSSTSPFFVNYTGLEPGTYYLNASAIDGGGMVSWTETRNITLYSMPAVVNCSYNQTSAYKGEFVRLIMNVSNGTYPTTTAFFELNHSVNLTYTSNSGNIYWYDLNTSTLEGNYSLRCFANDSINNLVMLDDGNLSVSPPPDTVYPSFVAPTDNSWALNGSGNATFFVQVFSTNGTVWLSINSTNYSAASGGGSSYNVNAFLDHEGNYTYAWYAYGDGSAHNLNHSSNMSYVVNSSIPYYNVTKTSRNSTYVVNVSTVNYMINITNRGLWNITEINVTDTFAFGELRYNTSSIPETSSGGTFVYWYNITRFIGGPLQPNQSLTYYVNMTPVGVADNVSTLLKVAAYTRGGGNLNISINASYINITYPDAIYPGYANYTDNNRSLVVSGNANFSVNVSNTNGTVLISINGTNYSATATGNGIYKYNLTLTKGTYTYYWTAYGNGVSNNMNRSENRTYIVNASAPSITVYKTFPNAAYYNGSRINYTIRVNNTGNESINYIWVNDTYNASQLAYNSSNISVSSFGTGWLFWDNITNGAVLAPNQSVSFTVNMTINSTGTVTNNVSAHAVSIYDQHNAGNASASLAAMPLVFAYNLSVSSTNSSYHLGSKVLYTINITNRGTDNITWMQMNYTYNSTVLAFNSSNTTGYVNGSGSVYWATLNLGNNLQPNQSLIVLLNMTTPAPSNGTTCSVNVSAYYANGGPLNASANSSMLNITYMNYTVSKTKPTSTYYKGSNVGYTVIVLNTGTENISRLNVTDYFNASQMYYNASFLQVNQSGAGWLFWNNLSSMDLMPGYSIGLVVNMTLNATGNVINNASASAVSIYGEARTVNASANVTVDVLPVFNVTVSMAAKNSSIWMGDMVQYQINVTNNGESNITNLQVNDSYDAAHLAFNSTNASTGYVNGTGWIYWANLTGGVWLHPHETYSFTLNLTGLAAGVNVANTVNVTAMNQTGSNLSVNSTTLVNINTPPDTVYPGFDGYVDNNATIYGSGTAYFRVNVSYTNGTVVLNLNGTNYTANNITANTFNVSLNLNTGAYTYVWYAYGNGTGSNLNQSANRTYVVLLPNLAVTPNSPANQSLTDNNTPPFNYTVTGGLLNYSCQVFVDGIASGMNSTVSNNTPTIIVCNHSLNDGDHAWNVSCSKSGASNSSGLWNLTVDAPPDITHCMTLDIAGATYNLSANVSSYYTCMPIGAENVTLDCRGFLVNYSRTALGYGIDNSGGYRNLAVKNCAILEGSSLTDSYGIYQYGAQNGTIWNNTIRTAGDSSHGLMLYVSSNNTVYGNAINTSGSSADGIYFFQSNYDAVYNNTISTSGQYGHGIYLYFSNHDNLSRNSISASAPFTYGAYVYGGLASNNVISNSSIASRQSYGLYYSNAGSNNTVYNCLINGSSAPVNLSYSGNNTWNISRQPGSRMYSPGNEIAGNYYTNSSGTGYSDTCADANHDGFCDSAYDLLNNSACGGISSCGNNTDYLPLSDGYDNDFPLFRNLTDNNGTLAGGGIANYTVNVTYTNGTVWLNLNGTRYDASMVAGQANTYNASAYLTSGTYTYVWYAYGNGTGNMLNNSENRTYVVLPDNTYSGFDDLPLTNNFLESETADLEVNVTNTNGSVFLSINDTVYPGDKIGPQRYSVHVNLTGGWYRFYWYSYGNGTGNNYAQSGDRNCTVNLVYPGFNGYIDNNGSLTGSGTASFNVSVSNTNGSVFLNLNGTSHAAVNTGGNHYNYDLTLTAGTYTYVWYSYGNATSHSFNESYNRTYTVNEIDSVYPGYTGYQDNNATLYGSGIAYFHVNVSYTNGTVYLDLNGTNYTANNITANTYNVSLNLSAGTYTYVWQAYGNGTGHNLNNSQNMSYVVYPTHANVTVTKTSDYGEYVIGNRIQYLINITNTGTEGINLVKLVDNYSSSMLFNGSSIPPNATGANWIFWSNLTAGSTLAPNQSFIIYVNMTSGAVGNVTNNAWVNATGVSGQNASSNATAAANVTADTIYPGFSDYYDNNATLNGTGNANYSVNVSNTNGTVVLNLNGTNYTASQIGANRFSYNLTLTTGTYTYVWYAWGNGTMHNLNTSVNKSYIVNASIDTSYPLFAGLPMNNSIIDTPSNNFTVNVTYTNGSVWLNLNGTTHQASLIAPDRYGYLASMTNGIYTFHWYAYGNGSDHLYNQSESRTFAVSPMYPAFSGYLDNNATLTFSGNANFSVNVSNTNGTVMLDLNGTNRTATNVSNTYSYNLTLAAGTYTYLWYAYGNGSSHNLNQSDNRTYIVLADTIYPGFSSYLDNNASLNGSGLASFNVTVTNTNGVVVLNLNGTNHTANYVGGIYNVSTVLSAGTYTYVWYSWGNGPGHNFNQSDNRTYIVNETDVIYPGFNAYADNNASLTVSGNANFSVNVSYTNGTVILDLNGTNYSANQIAGKTYSFNLTLSTGTYTYLWYAYGNGSSRNMNQSANRTYIVLADTIYPGFSSYLDNNASLNGSGIASFNVTVSSTNGVVVLNLNGTNYTANNLAGTYNVSTTLTAGVYTYVWYSWGSGPGQNFNQSANRTYVVNETDMIYPGFSGYLDNNASLTVSGNANYSVNVSNTNGTVILNLNGTNHTATNISNNYNYNLTLSTGTYTYSWYAYGNGSSHNLNQSDNRTYIVLADTIYPGFSSYLDNNASLNGSGLASFNVTVSSTNGNVVLNLNGTNHTANYIVGGFYNFSTVLTTGVYTYVWYSWGNGPGHNFNQSENRTYVVNETDMVYPGFNGYADNNASLTVSGNANFSVNVSYTNGTVILDLNGTNYSAADIGGKTFNYNLTLSTGTYTYLWYAYGNGSNHNLNHSANRTYVVLADTVYPVFSNYRDNNATQNGSGIASFNVTVSNTNNTVKIYINNTYYEANYTGGGIYNFSINLTNGSYDYSWLSYGNGPSNNPGTSAVRTYVINDSIDTIYPGFVGYADNNATLTGSGNANYRVNVSYTNGTVLLHINGANYSANNVGADTYEKNLTMSAGTFPYYWIAYGNGTRRNINDSQTRSYVVNASNMSYTVTKSSQYPYYNVGDTIAYSITITNTGNTNLDLINVNDSYNPAQLTYIASNVSPTSTGSGYVYWFNVTKYLAGGKLQSGQTYTLQVNMTPLLPLNNIANDVSVNATDSYGTSGTMNFPTPVNVSSSFNYSVQKTANVSSCTAGDSIGYTINITNNGGTDITLITVEDSYNSSQLSYNASNITPAGVWSDHVYWYNITNTIGASLHPAQSIYFTVFMNSLSAGTNAPNNVSVNASDLWSQLSVKTTTAYVNIGATTTSTTTTTTTTTTTNPPPPTTSSPTTTTTSTTTTSTTSTTLGTTTTTQETTSTTALVTSSTEQTTTSSTEPPTTSSTTTSTTSSTTTTERHSTPVDDSSQAWDSFYNPPPRTVVPSTSEPPSASTTAPSPTTVTAPEPSTTVTAASSTTVQETSSTTLPEQPSTTVSTVTGSTTTTGPSVTTSTAPSASTTQPQNAQDTRTTPTTQGQAGAGGQNGPSGNGDNTGRDILTLTGPVASVGGPYSGIAGTPVSFNASNSSGTILSYGWDYGDGATGSGPETTHAYLKEGSYRVTLRVTDDQGRVDSSSSGVFISPSTVYIDVSADPSKERYDLGDVISGVDAVVSHSGSDMVEGATVSGTLAGLKTVPLSFKENGSGKYHAILNYPIVKGETGFINITVEAKDPSGRSGRVVKKLILLPKETELMLNIHKPDKSEYAYGQKIGFEARFLRSDTLEVMEKGDLVLYEGWSDKEYPFTRQGNDYVLTYDIPRDARNPVSFIIYGNGYSAGKNYQAAKEIRFDLTHELKGEILSPTQGSYASDVREIKLRVSYPDGTTVPDDKLSAYVGNESVVLRRSGEFFEGNYTPSSNKSDLTLWIFDALGNGGQAKLKLAIRLPQRDQSAYAQQMAYAILPVIALLAAVFLAYRFVQGRLGYKKNLRKEYDETVQKIESLKAVTNNVMNEYYTHKITEEESRNRILDIEKELVVERQKLKALAQKMGSAPAETRTEKADSPAETNKPEEEVKKAVEGDGSEGQKNPE